MELTVLGAGPAYSDRPGALGSSYLVRSGPDAILLDLGQGVFPSLAGRLEPSTLRGVVISHLHPDHFIDLVPLRHYLRFEFDPPRRVAVHAPAGLADRLDALHAHPGFTEAAFDVHPFDGRPIRLGRFTIETAKVTHTPDSHAMRVTTSETSSALVYSGDCGRAMDLAPLVRPGDTLLVEVAFGPGPVPVDELHLDAGGVGELAAATRPGLILLTHLQMGYDPEATLAAVRARTDAPARFVAPGDDLAID
jgi:ribonuclease BN (tRNA processing enzyme)